MFKKQKNPHAKRIRTIGNRGTTLFLPPKRDLIIAVTGHPTGSTRLKGFLPTALGLIVPQVLYIKYSFLLIFCKEVISGKILRASPDAVGGNKLLPVVTEAIVKNRQFHSLEYFLLFNPQKLSVNCHNHRRQRH